jgi:cation diffusion facilitator CzcD-associated flavoprotein CzcO
MSSATNGAHENGATNSLDEHSVLDGLHEIGVKASLQENGITDNVDKSGATNGAPKNDITSILHDKSALKNLDENDITRELECLVVGMGFGGIYMMHRLRKLGYKVKAIEAGGGLGGIWWWNTYPGARVDTTLPFYELSDQELWKDWTWKEFFPGQKELQGYFEHVDKVWDLSKDVQYNTTVTAAKYIAEENKWIVKTDKNDTIKCQYLFLATGFSAKEHIPDFKGLETFKGKAFHSGKMPKGENAVDFQGQRVAVVGTGASGIQIVQELGDIAKHVAVFQRTPNLCLPMRQRQLSKEEQHRLKREYKYTFEMRKRTIAGWDYTFDPRKTFDVSPEERMAHWEDLWEKGGFRPWLGNYSDLMTSEDASNAMYAFWRDKVRERIHRPEMIDDLAPDNHPPGSPFGTKRPSLEQRFYEVVQQANVELINLKKRPIVEVTETGIITSDNGVTTEHPVDIIVLATGFDAGAGTLCRIDIQGIGGQTLKKKWSTGTRTHLGLATAGFPNLFFLYGPQSPGPFAIGPAAAEIQGDWIIECVEDMKKDGYNQIEALPAAENEWAKLVNDILNGTLISKSSAWYIGANIPGKRREAMNYLGGLPAYSKAIYDCTDNNYEGFSRKAVTV